MRILVVDDEPGLRQSLRLILADEGHVVADAASGDEALVRARAEPFDVVLCDVRMAGMDGLEFLRRYRADGGAALVIMMSAYGNEASAIAAMKEGAYDYLPKPFRADEVVLVLRKAEEREGLRREVEELRSALGAGAASPDVVAESAAMRSALDIVARVAPHRSTVLVTGPSGAGKEVIARELHRLSRRAAQAFVAINCAAIPETLLESEIFGHEKGAFTGALERRPGCFELAHEGTIFLDEIAEMNPGTQAKFLRILQDGTVRRLGGRTEIKVDVRVLAATNKDPVKAIQEGSFREDLYYRLNVVSLTLPPLRERRDDIPALVQAFLEEFNARYDKRIRSLDESVLSGLIAQPWPGNVRELRNTIERAMIVCEGDTILPKHIPPSPSMRVVESGDGSDSVSFPVGTSLEDAEKALILRTLAASGNNKTRAADVLGISLKTLHNKLKAYGG